MQASIRVENVRPQCNELQEQIELSIKLLTARGPHLSIEREKDVLPSWRSSHEAVCFGNRSGHRLGHRLGPRPGRRHDPAAAASPQALVLRVRKQPPRVGHDGYGPEERRE